MTAARTAVSPDVTSSSQCRTSPMSRSRRRGSFSRHRCSSRRTAGGVPAGNAGPVHLALKDRHDRVRCRLAAKWAATGEHLVKHASECPDVSPLVHRLAACLLGAHVRHRAKNHACARTSQTVIVGEFDRSGGTPSLASFARPKSRTLTTPSGVILMLEGFRSRWTIPAACAASSASAICWRRPVPLADVARPDQAIVERLAFHQLEHQRSNVPAVLEPIDGSDVRMIQRASRRASRLKRVTRSMSSVNAVGSTFSATSRSNVVSRARYTSPIPPAPRNRGSRRRRCGSLAAMATGCGIIWSRGSCTRDATSISRLCSWRVHRCKLATSRLRPKLRLCPISGADQDGRAAANRGSERSGSNIVSALSTGSSHARASTAF